MPKIQVFPTHENAHILSHPIDGKISDAGSWWEDDAFTARMITDNAVSTDKLRAHKFDDDKKADHTKPPAHATGAGVSAAPDAPKPVVRKDA